MRFLPWYGCLTIAAIVLTLTPKLSAVDLEVVRPNSPVKSEPPKSAAPAKKPAVESVSAAVESPPLDTLQLHLMDGSIISGKLKLSIIELETEFGLLKIPVESVRSFSPGLRSHAKLRAKIAKLVEQLAAEKSDVRELAVETLVELGPGVRPEIDRLLAVGDGKLKQRVKKGIEELEAQLESADDVLDTEGRPQLTEGDAVETATFTAVGRIVAQSFVLESPYGDLNIQLADIRRGQRVQIEQPEIRKAIKVDGVNLVQHDFVDCGIRVKRGDKISVSADGQIIMTPWGTEMKSTPDGGPNFDWYIQDKIPGGALVAKIGGGEVQKVGAKWTFVADRSGVLRFAVAMNDQYADQAFPGNYNVRIRVKPR